MLYGNLVSFKNATCVKKMAGSAKFEFVSKNKQTNKQTSTQIDSPRSVITCE